jgi:hypothetical protein
LWQSTLGILSSRPARVVLAAMPTIMGIAVFVLIGLFAPQFARSHSAILGPIAILLSALSAVLLVVLGAPFSARAQMDVAKVKAAYDDVSRKQWDKDYIEAREQFIGIVRAGGSADEKPLEFYVEVNSHSVHKDKEKEVAAAVRGILNDHELTAIGIKLNVLDEGFLKEWHRTTIVSDYQTLRPFIDKVRTHYKIPRAFVEFEDLAIRWDTESTEEKLVELKSKRKRGQ